MSHISIEKLTQLDEFTACVALQDEVWGYEAADRMTQKVFLLAANIGGQVFGAFDSAASDPRSLIGYAMSLPGVRNGRPYLHSHHLAVLPAWRNAGVGRRLKQAQREDAIERGVERIEWTFDPLEIRNAHLNIARLGAVVRSYRRNFYGPSSSPLQGGLPTDRIIAEWWLTSEHVESTLKGEAPRLQVLETVDVPAEIYAWKASKEHRSEARSVQERNAVALESAFARGLSVLGYERTERGDGRFLLGHWDEKFAV